MLNDKVVNVSSLFKKILLITYNALNAQLALFPFPIVVVWHLNLELNRPSLRLKIRPAESFPGLSVLIG